MPGKDVKNHIGKPRFVQRNEDTEGRREERPEIDLFLTEILDVCRKHKMSISHEDSHGAFVIDEFSPSNASWLSAASVRGTLAER